MADDEPIDDVEDGEEGGEDENADAEVENEETQQAAEMAPVQQPAGKAARSALDSVVKMVEAQKFNSALLALQQADMWQRERRPQWKKKHKVLLNEKVREVLETSYEEMEEAFAAFDINQDGKVSVRELRTGLSCLDSAVSLTEDDIQEVMEVADEEGVGYIDIKEFLRTFGPHAVSDDEIKDGLHSFGRTADGRNCAYLGLSLPNSKLSDIVNIRAFKLLQSVDVSHNCITNLSPLGCLSLLRDLDCSHNQLRHVLSFRPPVALRHAKCTHNLVTEMNSLAHHRFLESLDLSHNRISRITGVCDNSMLHKLVVDGNELIEISGLADLPLTYFSARANRLSAVQGITPLSEQDLELLLVFEECFDEMADAFEAMDIDGSGQISKKEMREGLLTLGVSSNEAVDQLLSRVDASHDGEVDLREFMALFQRSRPTPDDPGLSRLSKLQHLDLSENPITHLTGLEHLANLTTLWMSGTGIHLLDDLAHIAALEQLFDLDLTDTPLMRPADNAERASCCRLKAINVLLAPHGATKVHRLNQHLVSAEEVVSARNFHDEQHVQFEDTRRDDAQDLPAKLFL